MNYRKYFECRFTGDEFDGNFSGGLTLANGETTKLLNDDIEKKGCSDSATDSKNHFFSMKCHKAGDCSIISTTVKNKGAECVSIEMISAVALRGLVFDKVHRLKTFWSEECCLKTDTLEDLQLIPGWAPNGVRIEKFFNASSAPNKKFHPFICLENSATHDFLALMLGGGTPWQIELFWRADEYFLSAGPADNDVGHWKKNIAPGESFETCDVYLAEGNSLEEVCAKLVFAQEHDYSGVDDGMPVIFNEYCTTWGNPSEENVNRILNTISGKDIRYFVIDAGWYKENEQWWCDQGNWNVDCKSFPHGMKAVTDRIIECGFIPGVWFELEIAGRGVSVFGMTEHLLKRDGVPLTVGSSRFWDMTDSWVQDYLEEKVIGFLKANNFGYIKIDYNAQIPVGCDGYESLGEGLHRQMAATRAFFARIKREIPDIVIELCASGGHRIVPDFLKLVSQASFSDAHECKYIPCVAANLLRVMPARQSQIWAVIRADDSCDRITYSLVNTFLGRMCLSGDVYDISKEKWDIIDEGIRFYKEVSPVIEYGSVISMESEYKDITHPTGNQIVVKKYQNRKLVVVHRFEKSHKIDESVLGGKLIRKFGSAHSDWTSCSWLVEV